MAESNLYRNPTVRGPQLEEYRALNEELKYNCSEEELQELRELTAGFMKAFQRVDEMVDTAIPVVKYPRTPGYKPKPEDNPCNAWAWRCEVKGALKGKLAGKRVAIKDNTAVAGVPMANGTRLLDTYIPDFDATVVTRILDEGGLIIGKSNVDDMCFSGSGLTSCEGPVRNPADESRVVGGSSAGSGALVAGGLVDMATGGDQGGSIRIPSSFCGIVGLKPTWGLVPYTGAASIEPTIDHLGPMARTVTDCALLLEVIAGYDEGRDPRQPPNITVPEYSKLVDAGVSGKRIGLLTEGFNISEQYVQQTVTNAANKLTQAGCTLVAVSNPMHNDGTSVLTKGYYPTSMMEATFRGRLAHTQDMQPFMKRNSLAITYFDRHYGNKLYGKAMNLLMELGKSYDKLLEEVDVLIMPTLPYAASKIPPKGCSLKDLNQLCFSMTPNTMPFNSTGHPAITINAGFSSERLPIGMMIVGRKFEDLTVLQMARAFEKLP